VSEVGLAARVVPIALMLIMLALGLSLETRDFRRVLRSPAALVAGLVGQLVLLPVLGTGLALAFGVDPPLALGIVVLSLCPGGALSNALSAFAGADLALSVSLTAGSSLLAPVTLPLAYGWAAGLVAPAAPELSLPFARTFGSLVGVTVVPIVVGMMVRARAARATARLEQAARILATALFLAVVAVVVVQNADGLRAGLRATGVPLAVLGLAATSAGLLIGAAARLGRTAAVTLGIEIGMQNVATATFVTATLLGDVTMALAPAVYAFVMLAAAGLLALVSRATPGGAARAGRA